MMTAPKISITSIVEALRDQDISRFDSFMFSHRVFDRWGNFVDKTSQTRTAAEILIRDFPLSDVNGGQTEVVGISDVLLEKTLSFYIRDTEGGLHGWKNCVSAEPGEWHYGVLFKDDRGDLWFAGRDEDVGGLIDWEEAQDIKVFRKVHLEPGQMAVRGDFFDILDDHQAFEAEVFITAGDGDHPNHVVNISMGAGFGCRPADLDMTEEQSTYLEMEKSILRVWRDRIRALETAPMPEMS